MSAEHLRIIQIEQPLSYAGEHQWLLDGCHQLTWAHYMDVHGNDDLVNDVTDGPVWFNNEADQIRRWWCGVLGPDGDPASVVALGKCDLWRQDEKLANVMLLVHPDHRRKGIGAELLSHMEAHPDLDGRTVLICWNGDFSAKDDLGEQVLTPGGAGAPVATPGLQFALKHGYNLEQVERLSVCPLPANTVALERFVAESTEKAPGYCTMTWTDHVPPEHLDGYAVLMTKIYDDAPKGDLCYGQDVWDAARVVRAKESLAAMGYASLITVAQHEESGELAAMTIVTWKPTRPQFGYQEETVVLAAHRGRRLGMLIKALNLQALAVENPQCERLYTWNAEENDYMLSINVALGYVPFGGNCSVQKLR